MRGIGVKLRKRWTRLWIKPVRVFCFHQVSDVFDSDTMKECDWMQTEAFKKKILVFKQQYTFVSLEEAYSHIAIPKSSVSPMSIQLYYLSCDCRNNEEETRIYVRML